MFLFVFVDEILHDFVVLFYVNAHVEILKVFGHYLSHLVGNRPLVAPFQIGTKLCCGTQTSLFLRHKFVELFYQGRVFAVKLLVCLPETFRLLLLDIFGRLFHAHSTAASIAVIVRISIGASERGAFTPARSYRSLTDGGIVSHSFIDYSLEADWHLGDGGSSCETLRVWHYS